MTKRFRTLDEYLLLEGRVSKLYREAENNAAVLNGIYSNDKIYDMVSINFGDTSVLYNYLKSSCKLCDIKKALQAVKDAEARKEFDNIALNLYAKYLPEDDYIALATIKNGNYVDRSFLPTRQKINQFRSVMNANTSVKHQLFRFTHGKNAISQQIDQNDLNDMTDEYRQAFIGAYDKTMNDVEKYVVKLGGLVTMNDNALDACYYWFIQFLGSEINNVNKNAKIDRNPVKYFTFLNVLEEKMRREEHPTMMNGYYNLHARTLVEEFSYLLQQPNGKALLDVRTMCIRHCAANAGDSCRQ